ncbi:MAG: formimidoylglutamase, partial [Bdellovibrionales bacterium]
GELVQPINESLLENQKPSWIMMGYPDDEGIRANYGRVGSAEAPDSIRSAFFKLAPGNKDFASLLDIGNFIISGSLAERQARAKESIKNIFQHKHRVLALGGGHDYAYPDIAAFLDIFGKKNPLVIQIDAHLDVRPTLNGPNSGSAFYQLLEEYPKLELVQIGIQPCANSILHMAYAKSKGVKTYTFDQTRNKLESIFNTLAKTLTKKPRPVFLSIDIDAFSTAFAPGASASLPIGLDANEFVHRLPTLVSNTNIYGVGIYEVSPPLDRDNQTSKLAAQILHTVLFHADK